MTHRPLRIVYCLDNLGVGGTEMNATRVAEHLDRSRFDLSVACFNGDGALRRRLDAAGVPVRVFPITSLYGVSALREGVRFARLLRHEHVDIVHAHDRYANVFAVPWARVAGTRGIVASKRWGSISRIHGIGNRFAYRLAHRVLGNSSRVGASLVNEDGVPAEKVLVVPNFVDDAAFDSAPAQWVAEMRADLALGPESLVVGIVANLRIIKDHATLLRAVALLRARFPQLVVVIVGTGDTRPALEQLADELGIRGMLRFAGGRANLPNLHQLFDVSVLCSLSEGFPNTLVEAMAAGRPVVATAVGGVADAVEHGRTGLLVPPSDPDAFAAALAQLLGSDSVRATFGSEGRKDASARFRAAAVVPVLQDFYETLNLGRR